MTTADNTFLAGFHVAKTAGSTVAEHARVHLGEPDFYYYDRFTRTRRFWAGIPQYEELPEHDKNRIRMIFGHGIRFSVVNLQDRIPEFFTTIRHPVPHFRSRFTHQRNTHARRLTNLSFETFLKSQRCNHLTSLLVKSFGELADFGDEVSRRNAVSILRNFKYLFTTEHIDVQSTVLWNSLGVPSAMERKRVAKQWEPAPISDDEILAMHDVDLQLYNDVATVRSADMNRDGALNPYGYEREMYLDRVTKYRDAVPQNPELLLKEAYRELANQLFLDLDLEAAIDRMRVDASHVRRPELLRQLLMQKHEDSAMRYGKEQRQGSRRNAEAYRSGRYTGAAVFYDAMEQRESGNRGSSRGCGED